MGASEAIQTYMTIFKGASDKFTIHTVPFSKNAKGKVTGRWTGLAEYGTPSFPDIPNGYEERDFVPVTVEQYRAHLNGFMGLAISPLIPQINLSDTIRYNVCAYGIIDIDFKDYDFMNWIVRLYRDGFKFVPVQSKSGGLHIYFLFLEGYESAKDVIEVLQEIITVYGMNKFFTEDGISKVEYFPEHAERKASVKADKGVLLPYFNAREGAKGLNRVISPDGTMLGINKGLAFMQTQGTTIKEMRETLSSLPYRDAPYCIQSILLSGALTDGSHRNDFLFTTALYLKLKHGIEGFTHAHLSAANDRLDEPVAIADVTSTYNSAMRQDYPILGQCKKQPMTAWCDKALCKEQAYSAVKRDKNNIASNIIIGKIIRMKAENPYYLMEVKPADKEDAEFKLIHLDEADSLLNQKTLQKGCIDAWGLVPWTVKQQVWEARLNEVMQNLEEREVPKETDTTELSELHGLFNRYLTHRQVQSNNPFRITLKQVYFDEATNQYYFQTDGFKDYLRIAKYVLGRTNLREQLINYGCTEGAIEFDRRDGTKGIIKCWVKEADEELLNMRVYFDDVTDQDEQTIEMFKLNKQEKEAFLPASTGEELF